MKTVNTLSATSVKTKVPRGGLPMKSYTTTNLLQHLSMKHAEIHKQYLERKESNEATAKVPKEM